MPSEDHTPATMEGQRSLKDLFAAAEKLRVRLDSLQASSEQYQTTLQDALKNYQQCRDLTERASIFSPNETTEDVATSDLRYLSIDYLIADLLSRYFQGDRAKVIVQSQTAYAHYLGRLDDYDILTKDQRQLYQRFLEDKDSFSVMKSNDPSTRRHTKIARFQEEKQLRDKIQHLESNPRTQQDDDALVRELRLAELSLQSHQAFQALDFINQEMKIVSQMPEPTSDPRSAKSDGRQEQKNADGDYSERLDLGLQSMLQNGKSGPILSKSGRPLQPFTLLDSRERLRNGVFKSGHNLPTMTIDEYLEEERRRGGIIEGGGEPPVVEPNEDDLEAADRETMKAREWDEFVEANPKGSGNTLNRG